MRRVNVNSFFWTVAAFLFAYMNDAKGIPEGSQRSVAMKKISLSLSRFYCFRSIEELRPPDMI